MVAQDVVETMGGDLWGTAVDGPPKNFVVGDGPCLRPPTIIIWDF